MQVTILLLLKYKANMYVILWKSNRVKFKKQVNNKNVNCTVAQKCIKYLGKEWLTVLV